MRCEWTNDFAHTSSPVSYLETDRNSFLFSRPKPAVLGGFGQFVSAETEMFRFHFFFSAETKGGFGKLGNETPLWPMLSLLLQLLKWSLASIDSESVAVM